MDDATRLSMCRCAPNLCWHDASVHRHPPPQVPAKGHSPLKDGFVTFAAFLSFGLMPLVTYCVFPFVMPQLTQVGSASCRAAALTRCATALTRCAVAPLRRFHSTSWGCAMSPSEHWRCQLF